MIVRIRFQTGRAPSTGRGKNRHLAMTASALMQPVAFGCVALACWRIGADMNWVGEFAIERGLFSHWQVWLASGLLLFGAAAVLSRYGTSATEPLTDS